jgi:hypothetical protein
MSSAGASRRPTRQRSTQILGSPARQNRGKYTSAVYISCGWSGWLAIRYAPRRPSVVVSMRPFRPGSAFPTQPGLSACPQGVRVRNVV